MIAAHKAAEMTMVLFIPTDLRPDPATASIAAARIPRERKDSGSAYYT